MNFENKLARLMRNTGPARVFVPMGLVMIVFGILMLGFKTDDFVQTTGKITSVEEYINSENQKEYDVGFTYEVDGKAYEGLFANLSGGFSEGADITIYYNPENPEQTTNSKLGGFFAPLLIALGALAIGFGVFQTTKAFKKSKALDESAPGASSESAFEGFRNAPGVTEYYFRFDGNTLKPGYIVEDAARKVLFEGKMTRNALVGARMFLFVDHTTGRETEHEVGHTVTNSYNDEFFSIKSSFKFDGENVWDALHNRGLRMTTSLFSKFPRITYNVTKDGAAFAQIETSSRYVHEEDEAQHKLVVPAGRMYYRFWTASDDFDSLFLTIFAISETEQTFTE